MPKKEKEVPTVSITKVKEPKTVKVSTIIKTAVAIISILSAFGAGWYSNTAFNNYDQNRIKNEAKALVTELKSQK